MYDYSLNESTCIESQKVRCDKRRHSTHTQINRRASESERQLNEILEQQRYYG